MLLTAEGDRVLPYQLVQLSSSQSQLNWVNGEVQPVGTWVQGTWNTSEIVWIDGSTETTLDVVKVVEVATLLVVFSITFGILVTFAGIASSTDFQQLEVSSY